MITRHYKQDDYLQAKRQALRPTRVGPGKYDAVGKLSFGRWWGRGYRGEGSGVIRR